jgi:hypothetical protein
MKRQVELEQIHPKLFATKRTKCESTQKDVLSTDKNDLPRISMLSVEEVLKSYVLSLDIDNCEAESDNAFIVADLGEVYRQHLRWQTHLPRIKPFYGKLR